MPTLYTNAASVTDGPNIYHTVSYTIARDGTDVNITVTISSHLQYDGSWIGPGKELYFLAEADLGSVGWAADPMTMKPSSSYWVKIYPGGGSSGSPRVVGTITKTVTIAMHDVGNIGTLVLRTSTLRTDGTGKPGCHTRSNTIAVPVPAAPAIPSLTAVSPTGTYMYKAAVTLTAVNNGNGDGSFSRFIYQYSRNGGAWSLTTYSALTSIIDHPALAQGDSIRYRVGVENSFGQVTWSAPTAMLYEARSPAKVTNVVASAPVLSNPSNTVVITWDAPSPGDGAIAAYRVAVTKTWGVTTWKYYDLGTTRTLSFALSVTGAVRGEPVAIVVIAKNAAGAWGAEYSEAITVTSANYPADVAVFSFDKSYPRLTDSIVFYWGWVSAGTGIMSNYCIEYRYRAGATGVWSIWYSLVDAAGTAATVTRALSSFSQFAHFTPETQLQFRIRAKNQYGLYSVNYTTINAVADILGGLLNIKVGTAFIQGLSYYKDAATWKVSDAIYNKISGAWVEGTG